MTGRILQVEERAHSPISPSSYDRTSRCTASYQLTQASRRGGALRAAGGAANEGNAAHALLEHELRYGISPDEIEAVRVGGVQVPVTSRMRDAVAFAITWVRKHLAGRELTLERQIRLPWGKVAGWADVATIDAPWTVVDFKFGHTTVAATSPQLALYLIGLILEHERSIEGDGEATAIIIQPRAQADPVRTHVWTYEALRRLRDQLIEVLHRIRRVEYSVGSWCKFCQIAGTCPALAATARDAAATEIGIAPELIAAGEAGATQINEALLIADALEHRIRQSWAVAHEYLTAGGKLADFKLVTKPRGGFTIVPRSDRRPEVDVGQSLRLALRSSVALEYVNATRSSTA